MTRRQCHIWAAIAGSAAAIPCLAGDPCDAWNPFDPLIPGGSAHTVVRDLFVLSPDNVWAVGTAYYDQIKPFSAHFNGQEWNFVPVPDPIAFADSGLWAVGASGPDNIWAAGDREYSPPLPFAFFGTHIFVVRWNGSQWQMMQTPHLGGGSGDRILGIKALSPDNVWFVGDHHPQASGPQPALAMRWNGSQFIITNVPIVNPETGRDAGNTLYDIDDLPGGVLWTVGGSDVNAQGNYSQIHRWDGNQWHHVPGPTPGYYNQLFAVEAIAPDNIWAAGEYWDNSGIHPLLLRWDGSSWMQVPSPGGILDLHAFGPDDLYAVGSAIFHWNGSQWSTVETFPEVPSPTMAAVHGPQPCDLFVGGRQILFGQIQGFAARAGSAGGNCYANCDASTQQPALNVADFSCFLTKFASGDAYANCDQSTQNPVLNVADFSCFLTKFAAGCP